MDFHSNIFSSFKLPLILKPFDEMLILCFLFRFHTIMYLRNTHILYRILLDFRLPIIPHNILNTPLYFFTFIHSHILSISFFLGRLSSTQIYKISIKCVQLFSKKLLYLSVEISLKLR